VAFKGIQQDWITDGFARELETGFQEDWIRLVFGRILRFNTIKMFNKTWLSHIFRRLDADSRFLAKINR
jgi:hypothetical protein